MSIALEACSDSYSLRLRSMGDSLTLAADHELSFRVRASWRRRTSPERLRSMSADTIGASKVMNHSAHPSGSLLVQLDTTVILTKSSLTTRWSQLSTRSHGATEAIAALSCSGPDCRSAFLESLFLAIQACLSAAAGIITFGRIERFPVGPPLTQVSMKS